jgi:hypothetical protein
MKIIFICKILIVFSLLSISKNFDNYCYAQDTTISIKYDTILIPTTRIIKIIKLQTVPKFILHFSGGYNSGAMELTGQNGGFNRVNFILGRNFGARNGYGFNIIGKLPLNKKGLFWLDVITGFDRFQSNIFADNTEEGKIYYNSFNGGIGLEYNITPSHKVKYYFGANPLISLISGKAEIYDDNNNKTEVKIKNSLRLGYQAFMGIEYAIDKNFGFNISLNFTHANLLLKKSETPQLESNGVNPVITSILNDNPTSNNTEFAGWKQFAYFSIKAGFSVFLGVKERRYKLP